MRAARLYVQPEHDPAAMRLRRYLGEERAGEWAPDYDALRQDPDPDGLARAAAMIDIARFPVRQDLEAWVAFAALPSVSMIEHPSPALTYTGADKLHVVRWIESSAGGITVTLDAIAQYPGGYWDASRIRWRHINEDWDGFDAVQARNTMREGLYAMAGLRSLPYGASFGELRWSPAPATVRRGDFLLDVVTAAQATAWLSRIDHPLAPPASAGAATLNSLHRRIRAMATSAVAGADAETLCSAIDMALIEIGAGSTNARGGNDLRTISERIGRTLLPRTGSTPIDATHLAGMLGWYLKPFETPLVGRVPENSG